MSLHPIEVDPAEHKKMIQSLTFHRQEVDDWVVHTGCLERSRESSSSATHFIQKCKFHTNTKMSLGTLKGFPIEIIHEILSYLPILDISNFRSVNPLAEIFVNSIQKYHEIITYAPNTVEALIIVGVASYFTVDDLNDALRSKTCKICGEYGMLLFMLNCSRCCDRCLRGAKELGPLSMIEARVCFGLTEKQLRANAPVLVTLPGRYTVERSWYRSRGYFNTSKYKLVGRSMAREAGIVVHGGREDTIKYVKSNQQKKYKEYDKRYELWKSSGSIRHREPKQPTNTYLPYCWVDKIQRFMVATPIPYYNSVTGKAQFGVCCMACEGQGGSSGENEDRPYKSYLEEEWLVHFQDCPKSQVLWELSEHGNKKVGIQFMRQKDN